MKSSIATSDYYSVMRFPVEVAEHAGFVSFVGSANVMVSSSTSAELNESSSSISVSRSWSSLS
jgi:hypothetical protein